MSLKKPDFAKLRDDFPMLKHQMHGKPLIYLDTAATAQKPQVVIDSITNFYHDHYGTVHRAVYELCSLATQEYEETREKLKKLINASKKEEIVYTRGTTDSINLIAQSFGKAFIKPGDEIIISELEHHSNIVPWQMLCKDRDATLLVIPMNDQAELEIDLYEHLLSGRTKLVSIAHVANATGTIHPIKKMIEMAHSVGAKVHIDGAQSVPHMPVDVRDLDADFYSFSGHKLYGPTGVGVLYGKEKLLAAMPPSQGGGDMVDTVTFAITTYNPAPIKFEAGTPMIAEVIGLGAAVDYIQAIGLQHIQQWEHELLIYATKLMQKIPKIRIIGTAREKGPIISFVHEGTHHLDIGTMLDLRGIAIRTGNHCAQPTMRHFNLPGTCRASFAFYNTKQEVEQFVAALDDVVSALRRK